MRLYETVIVFDPQLKAPEIEDSIKKFTNFIANHGGEIVGQDEWGKRRLAYEINRRQYGFYILLRFNCPGQLVGLLEREFKLNETILRHLTIKLDKKALQMEQALEQKQVDEAPEEKPEKVPESEGETAREDDWESEAVVEAEPNSTEELSEEDDVVEEKEHDN